MENTSELIKQLERTMKNGGNIDKYVAKLRRSGLQDTLIGPAEMSVLMYYVKGNQLNKVKALLEGVICALNCRHSFTQFLHIFLHIASVINNGNRSVNAGDYKIFQYTRKYFV